MKKLSLGILLLAMGLMSGCGSNKVMLDIPDDEVAEVERSIYPKWQAIYVMKDAVPETAEDIVGRRWICCSNYAHAGNNILYLTQKAKFLQIATFNLISGGKPKEWNYMKILEENPKSILVIDRDVKLKEKSKMVEIVFK